jgi:serine/threonine protein kinase
MVGALHELAADSTSAVLAPGTLLGPYQILSLIGVGGMGAVYRARDTRLDRMVALKHLSAHAAASAEGRRRFEREAHATSVLNHPHICTLHDVGEENGVAFLVMELLEGESLAARLQRGALPVSETIQYAAQMAEALAAAHHQGIVHRDLKPANIMITAHGVKLLDFGLAALRSPRGLIDGAHEDALTVAGTILGTLKYMAPEQLQGRPVDARADIFSLGAMLYEMLTGRSAFEADSSAGIVAAVLAHAPRPLTAVRPEVPFALDWTLSQCLAKSPAERWQSAADLARQLLWIEASGTIVDPTLAARVRRRVLAWVTLVAVLAVCAVATVAYLISQRQQERTSLSYRFEIPPPQGTSYERLFAISPNGRRLAFSAIDTGGVRSIWIRSLDASIVQRIAGTNDALYPFWSPDGGSIGFFADRKLKTVDLRSASVRVLTDAGRGGGATWNADGIIVFADESTVTTETTRAGLKRISASGGVATPIAPLGVKGTTIQAYPHFLPDGRHYLYMQMPLKTGESGVYVGQLDGGDPKRILPAIVTVTPERTHVNGPVRATYAAGHLFYVDGSHGALVAQPFDVTRLELTGAAVRIADNVENMAPGGSAYDVSPTGAFVYRPSAAPAPIVVVTNWPALLGD